jgi:hypothetical protein
MQGTNRAGLLALVVLALLVSACGPRTAQPEPQPTTAATVTPADTDAVSPLPLPTSATDAQSPLPPPTEVVTPTPTVPAFEMETFRDDVTGFEIDYPVGWTIIDPPAEVKTNAFIYSVTLQSWPLEEPGTHGIPEGGSKMDISIARDGAETLEAALASYRQSQAQAEMPIEVISEEELELASGLTGARFELKGSQGETYHTFVTSLNGHLIILSGLGDAAVFDAMIATLRPALAE